MLTAMKELPATLMLRPTGFDTLATELWSRSELAAFGSAAPYALAILQDGKLIAFGTPHALYHTPEPVAVPRLLSEINVIPATVQTHHSVHTEFGETSATSLDRLVPGEQGTLIMRPEALVIENNVTPTQPLSIRFSTATTHSSAFKWTAGK